MLIYNWKPEYTGRHISGKEEQDFEQVYLFGPTSNSFGKAPSTGSGGRSKGGSMQQPWFMQRIAKFVQALCA